MKPVLVLFACTLLPSTMVLAQGVGSSGAITGTVVDASGAVLPKVTASIVDTETGLKRDVVTDGTGHYRLTGLSPSTFCDRGSQKRPGCGRADGHFGLPDEAGTGSDDR